MSKQRQAIQSVYDEMKAGQREKEKYYEIPRNVDFIFRNIYEQCELQLKFLQELKEELLAEPQGEGKEE
ncbi:hypothetical protein M6D81_21680 [Paenibacillus sp. J5C_2022]|uniref:hypothetical protein n=1 Tax=Paenibacillus sp. J5C2022 TaxID=2977129 RepID=UPI0021CFBDEA|nr:hypothetical protein [Paenibacillus sp. J5C2022]MCU6711308.1 hypothetical protein [Paenibacillus sp. J5C2022]